MKKRNRDKSKFPFVRVRRRLDDAEIQAIRCNDHLCIGFFALKAFILRDELHEMEDELMRFVRNLPDSHIRVSYLDEWRGWIISQAEICKSGKPVFLIEIEPIKLGRMLFEILERETAADAPDK